MDIRKIIRESLENFVIDKYGDTLKIDNNWLPMKFPISEYKTRVKDALVHIVMEEEEISEKAFGLVDETIEKVKVMTSISEDIINKIQEFEESDVRPQLAAENIYYEFYVNDDVLSEGKKKKKAKTKFQRLKDNKIPLTDEERAEVMKRKAVWHHGPNGEETPAVWKSKNRDGKVTYITNTHRVYQDRPTLKGAISIYHDFIKGTA